MWFIIVYEYSYPIHFILSKVSLENRHKHFPKRKKRSEESTYGAFLDGQARPISWITEF